MALIRCWECKKKISNNAEACPHCGAPKKALPTPTAGAAKKKGGMLKWVLGAFVVFVVIGSMQDKDPGASASAGTSAECAPGTPMSSGVVDVTGFGHVLYEAPDAASAQVINAKATEALGEKSYREANAETRVRPICEHGDWRKIEFVDPRWPEKGWVQVSALLPPRPAGTPRVYSDADVLLGDEKTMAANRSLFVSAVNRIHAQHARCRDRIIPIVHRSNEKGTSGQYFVTCGSGSGITNVFFSLKDIRSNKSFQDPRELAISENEAMKRCQQATRANARFPSSVDFSLFGSGASTQSNGTVIVRLDFEAKNGLGNVLPQRAICRYPVDGDPSIQIGAR